MKNAIKYEDIFNKNLATTEYGSIMKERNGCIDFYDSEERIKAFKLTKQIKSEVEFLLRDNEACQLYMCVKNTNKIPGDIAEVGCYTGGSSKIICEAKENKSFFVFDTFTGLPPLTDNDGDSDFEEGLFTASYNEVKKYLNKYDNVYLYKGKFPESSTPIKHNNFSFVHLDLDLYEATFESLKFFYDRVVKGGIILSHDYITSPGVRKAFDTFFRYKSEVIIEMSGSQCLVVKL